MKGLFIKLFGISYTDQIAKYTVINFAIVIAMFVVSAVMLALGLLPDNIPMQWNIQGEVNYYLPSAIGAWILPLIALFINVSGVSKGSVSIRETIITACMCIFMIILYIVLI